MCHILNSPPVFSGVRVARSLISCVVFCRSMFVIFSFFIWPLCFLSFLGFWLPLWSVQILLTFDNCTMSHSVYQWFLHVVILTVKTHDQFKMKICMPVCFAIDVYAEKETVHI